MLGNTTPLATNGVQKGLICTAVTMELPLDRDHKMVLPA